VGLEELVPESVMLGEFMGTVKPELLSGLSSVVVVASERGRAPLESLELTRSATSRSPSTSVLDVRFSCEDSLFLDKLTARMVELFEF
jgi:hypothetical protein